MPENKSPGLPLRQALSAPRFLQAGIVLAGAAALAFLLVEPHFEGRNRNATWFQVYFHDPFLAYVYAASAFFFTALRQAFKALGLIARGEAFTGASVEAVRKVKVCSLVFAGFVAAAELYIIFGVSDDRAGGIAVGLFVGTVAAVTSAAAAVSERVLREGLEG